MLLINALNVLIKLALPREKLMIKEGVMLKNINMKFDLDIMFAFILCMLIVLFTIQAAELKSLQTQVDELRIIVNQKTMPALMLDKNVFGIR
jgi:hypothetical protein